MENILKSNPEPGDGPQNVKLPPVRDQYVSQQMGTLLTAFNSVGSFLVNAENLSEERDSAKLDGGVKAAVEATLIQITSRIDTLLENPNCWGLGERVTLEKHSADVLELKKESIRLGMRPHNRFSPKFRRDPATGMWIVFIGDLREPLHCVIGIGPSLNDALEHFDSEFEGKQNEQNTQPVVPRGPDTIKDAEIVRPNERPDSGIAGADGKTGVKPPVGPPKDGKGRRKRR